MSKKTGASAAARRKNKERAEAAAKAREGQTVSTQNFVRPLARSSIINYRGILEYMVFFFATYYNCGRVEALNRLKAGADEGGVPMSVLRLAFIDYAITDERGLHSRLIKEKGEEEAAKYLSDIDKYKQLAIEDVDIRSGTSKQDFYEALHLTDELKEKCVMTRKSIVVKWNMYYSGIRRLRQQSLSVDDLSRQEPYPPEQRKAMVDLFAALEKRGLLQTTTRIKHILTSEELDILASAIWLIDISPMDRMSIALLIPLLEHTGLRPSEVLPSTANPTKSLKALDDFDDDDTDSEESDVEPRTGPSTPPASAAEPASLPQAHNPVFTETRAVFTWEDPDIVYKGIRRDTREPWFKVTIRWKHGKNRRPGEFIPTSASSARSPRAHRDFVRWLLIIGLWVDVFADAEDLRLLLLEDDPEAQAKTKLRVGDHLRIKPEMLKMPVLLQDATRFAHGSLDNMKVRAMAYKRANGILKRLADHPLANFSGLTFYDLRRTFATTMINKIPKEQINLLLGHRRLSSSTAATTYQTEFLPVDMTAILAGVPSDDPVAHQDAQEAAGRRYGQATPAIFSRLESMPEVRSKIGYLYNLRERLSREEERAQVYFLTQVGRPEGGELSSDSKLKLEIAEAEIDMLAFVRNLLGGMGVDLDELDAEAGHEPPPAHAHGESAAPNPSASVQEPSATSAAASFSEAVPLPEDVGTDVLDLDETLASAAVPDALVLDEQMQLLQSVVNQGLSPLCNLSLSKTVAFVGSWIANAELQKQRFCPDCFHQAVKYGLPLDAASHQDIETFCVHRGIFCGSDYEEVRQAIKLFVDGGDKMPVIGLDKGGLLALARHMGLENQLDKKASRERMLEFLLRQGGVYVPEDFRVPDLTRAKKGAKKRPSKGKARKKGKSKARKKASRSKEDLGQGEESCSSSGRTSSSTDSSESDGQGHKYGVNLGSVHIPCGPSLHPPSLPLIGKWCLLPKEVSGHKRTYLNYAFWIHLQSAHLESGSQRCWYCLEVINEDHEAHFIRCQQAFYRDQLNGEDRPVTFEDSMVSPSLRHATKTRGFAVAVSICHGKNTVGPSASISAQPVFSAMRRAQGTSRLWDVDQEQKIGCPVVLCNADKTSVREMLRHLANAHRLPVVRREGKWTHDLSEEEMKTVEPFQAKKDAIPGKLYFHIKMPPVP